jgi:hypothetical protein
MQRIGKRKLLDFGQLCLFAGIVLILLRVFIYREPAVYPLCSDAQDYHASPKVSPINILLRNDCWSGQVGTRDGELFLKFNLLYDRGYYDVQDGKGNVYSSREGFNVLTAPFRFKGTGTVLITVTNK